VGGCRPVVIEIWARSSQVETFRGDSRFTTWAYRFVAFDVSSKVSHHIWWWRVAAMQATWSQPVAEEMVFSNDLQPVGASEAAVGDLDAPGVSDGAEHRPLVVPPDPA
jgi:hypothetical protein